MGSQALLRFVVFRPRPRRRFETSAGFGQLGSAMAGTGRLPQRRFALARGLGGLWPHPPPPSLLDHLSVGFAALPAAGERPAHFALLLLVGVEPPELAAGHGFGECRVRTDTARTHAKGPTARPNVLNVLQGAPPMPGLSRGRNCRHRRARRLPRGSAMKKLKPLELLALHGSHLWGGVPVTLPTSTGADAATGPFCIRADGNTMAEGRCTPGQFRL